MGGYSNLAGTDVQDKEANSHMPHSAFLLSFVFRLFLQPAYGARPKDDMFGYMEYCSLQNKNMSTHGSGALGLSMRLTSANFRVFLALPMTQYKPDLRGTHAVQGCWGATRPSRPSAV